MKQGRKTTFEERIEIVNFTLAHEKDYQGAVEKYGVSYQQILFLGQKVREGRF